MAMRLRSLLRAAGRIPAADERRLRDLFHEIARAPRGDHVLPARLCSSLASAYENLAHPGRLAFLSILSKQEADADAIRHYCRELLVASEEDSARGAGALLRARSELREALSPASERVIERLAQQPDGLRFLVSLRADLLAAMTDQRSAAGPTAPASTPVSSPAALEGEDGERERWRGLDASLRRQFGVWFDTGLLRLERLTWEHTPGALLERIMAYERVHPFASWADLRSRLDGPRRALFAFLHPRLPGEPLVFVQVALVEQVPTRLRDVLPEQSSLAACDEPQDRSASSNASSDEGYASAPGAPPAAPPPATARVACFYTISSPHAGLRGVPIGGLLIKQVCSDSF